MRTADAVVWDQSHILQSGVYTGTYTVGGVTRSIDGWQQLEDDAPLAMR